MLNFHDKSEQTDGQTDRLTMVKQNAPNLLNDGEKSATKIWH